MLLLSMCSSETKEAGKLNLIGKWDVVEFVADMPKVDVITIQAARELAMETDYQFDDNGHVTTYMKSENAEINGTWNYDKKSNTLTIKNEFGPASNSKIISFSDTEMQWYDEIGGGLGSTTTHLKKY